MGLWTTTAPCSLCTVLVMEKDQIISQEATIMGDPARPLGSRQVVPGHMLHMLHTPTPSPKMIPILLTPSLGVRII